MTGSRETNKEVGVLPNFTPEELIQFRSAYRRAVERSLDMFEFKGQVFSTAFAEYITKWQTKS